MNFLTIDIGGTFTKYAVMDEHCVISQRGKVPTVSDTLDQFLSALYALCDKYPDTEGIAISAAGVIEENGLMHNGGSVTCISDLDLPTVLEAHCGRPVTVENDAKCAALAELWKGSLSDCRNAAALIIGTGVGGAIICERRILRGAHCMAGEFSYLLSSLDDPANPQKIIGHAAGMPALLSLAAQKSGRSPDSLTGEKVFDLAAQGDQAILEALQLYARRLAFLILNITFFVDPERIAIGGGVSAQPVLLKLIRRELTSLSAAFPYPVPVPEMTPCRFFNDSNLIGALRVHLKKRGLVEPSIS